VSVIGWDGWRRRGLASETVRRRLAGISGRDRRGRLKITVWLCLPVRVVIMEAEWPVCVPQADCLIVVPALQLRGRPIVQKQRQKRTAENAPLHHLRGPIG
jgi:hypothetical protein